MTDRFDSEPTELDSPANSAYLVSPNNTTDLPVIPRGIYVGVGGDIEVQMRNPLDANSAKITLIFVGAVAGSVLPIRPSRVLATNTTATGIIALI